MDQGQLVRSFVSLLVSLALTGLLLFLPAGTFAWPAAWALVAMFVVEIAIGVGILWRVNPVIFSARSSGFKPGTKRWDYLIGGALIVAIAPIAGLDYRLSGHSAPLPVLGVGHALFLSGFAVIAWAQAVNPFFEPGVRIQTERGHKVIDKGPYRFIRHPGYLGGGVFVLGLALALGSVAALGPALIAIAILFYRTIREDETLIAELPGYAAYTGRVRARWIPRVW
jgi:protein-S-isoprenylcysteine O-methyltransferase Ste14